MIAIGIGRDLVARVARAERFQAEVAGFRIGRLPDFDFHRLFLRRDADRSSSTNVQEKCGRGCFVRMAW